MYFANLADLWAMNGHGGYVWSAYAIVTLVMVGVVWLPLRRHRQVVTEIARRQSLEDSRAVASSAIETENPCTRSENNA